MQQAVQAKVEGPYRSKFAALDRLPEPLAALDRISQNFYWSWHPEGVELFRELDPDLWVEVEQNPRLHLQRVGEFRMWQKAADETYVSRLNAFAEKFDWYFAERANVKDIERSFAYFCAEYGVHNSLPNYSGGLGILAGDHLKSASDLNIPLVAVGLLYRYGYFRQRISHDGWQEERYSDVFESELALTPVVNDAGERVNVMVHIRGREVCAQGWLAQVGRISLYLLDTNLPQNVEIDRFITGHLYGGSTETRIVQEKVLGIGGVRLLRKLGLAPSVFHLNEGHSAFLTLELAREFLSENPQASFEDAQEAVRRQCVFTTHTPVAAGNDAFSPTELRECFDANFIASLKLSEDSFLDLGRVDIGNDNEPFGMTPFALRMCRSANGVSEKHGEVSRELWLNMFAGNTEPKDVPITHVTNGVHPPTWIAPLFQSLYERSISRDWHNLLADPEAWAAAVDAIPDSDVWSVHKRLKALLIAFIRERTTTKEIGGYDTIHEHIDTATLCSPSALTIGFARRVAAYKRWDLLFSDLDRLLKLVDDPARPVQFVFAGKAHPQDRTAKQILQHLMSINHDSNWQRRAVFIEDYDQEVARYLVQGVDVWMNVPRRPLEASGTSGMKAAMNGVLNFSVLDGWWIEGFNGENGFAIGPDDVASGRPGSEGANDETRTVDAVDAGSLYSVLEDQIIPAFYDKDDSGIPTPWVRRMKNAIATLTPQFSSDRMVREYVKRIYGIDR
ncbi:MAG TPA: alpha-glucan family phosphorylase [Pyrinomonadaceae bacterium]|nr:alpha-glucan family phosphorylase [Pyrinomonadaceae bacterium]